MSQQNGACELHNVCASIVTNHHRNHHHHHHQHHYHIKTVYVYFIIICGFFFGNSVIVCFFRCLCNHTLCVGLCLFSLCICFVHSLIKWLCYVCVCLQCNVFRASCFSAHKLFHLFSLLPSPPPLSLLFVSVFLVGKYRFYFEILFVLCTFDACVQHKWCCMFNVHMPAI